MEIEQPKIMVLLLHGFLGEPDDFRLVREAPDVAAAIESKRWSLVVPDLATAATRTKIDSLDSFAEWLNGQVREKMHEEGIETVYICGYSMGARLAAHCILASPRLYKGALLLSIHAGIESGDKATREARALSDRVWSEKLKGGEWREVFREWNLQSVLKPGSRVPARENLAYADVELRSRSIEGVRQAWARGMEIWSLSKQRDLTSELKVWAASSSLVLMTGTEDDKFTSISAAMARSATSIRHRTVLGAGHRVLLEAPDDVASELALLIAKPG